MAAIHEWDGLNLKEYEARRARVPRGYTVTVYDQAGHFRETKCASFRDACLVYDADRAAYPQKIVRVENPDRVDLGCSDGLTEEEREALDSRGLPTGGSPGCAGGGEP